MFRFRFNRAFVLMATLVTTPYGQSVSWAQPPATPAPVPEIKAALPVAIPGEQVVIRREAVRAIDPARYRIPLSLQASKRVEIVAPVDGLIKQISTQVGQKVSPQGELIRFDQTREKLFVQRADALHRAATLEAKIAEKGEADVKELAAAKLEAAKADLDLAKLKLEETSVRSPGNYEVERILVSENEFVRAGQPVIVLADYSRMSVEIPALRAVVEKSKTLPIAVDSQDVQATIDAQVPLASKFDSLRDLFDSLTGVVVFLENSDRKYRAGQTVYVPLIPRQSVVEVPASAIGNGLQGTRKVQVIRANLVRDIPVVMMGAVGPQRFFVSGALVNADEIIVEASHQMSDGFQLRPLLAAEVPTPATVPGAAGPAGNPPVNQPPKTSPGF